MKTLILGASRGVGRALAEECARRGHSLILSARNEKDLSALSTDLQLRFQVAIETVTADAACPEKLIEKLDSVCATNTPPDNLLFAIGASVEDDNGALSAERTDRLIKANLASLMATIQHYMPSMLNSNNISNIVGFSSIAAIRGRANNMVYAAAKRGLESYFESLRSLIVGSQISIQCYRLGYAATAQTYGKELKFPSTSPEQIARKVLKNFNKDLPIKHLPGFWKYIGFLVRHLPWFIYKKLQF